MATPPSPREIMAHNFLAECPHCHRQVEFMRSGAPELTRREVETLVYKTDLERVDPKLHRHLLAALTAFKF